MIPFSPPRIDRLILDEVADTLRSGWITTGPKTKLFERNLTAYCGNRATICLNSGTAGMELMLRWFGVGPGDEVIVPAYTYCATANVVVHCGATPVMVDVRDDFLMDPAAVKAAITPRTRAVIPVDFGGMPCDYDALMEVVAEASGSFSPASSEQEKLGRILLLADAAHSLGARYKGRRTGTLADATAFSFHAVKNLTTAEGGAVALNLPSGNEAVYRHLSVLSLHGQDRDALSKSKDGNWKYDVTMAGYKCNMPDILAAIGLVELQRYDADTLPRRKSICETYNRYFSDLPWARVPVQVNGETESSYHLYPLRIRDATESDRDRIIRKVAERGVSVNVHFIPLPALSYYRDAGFRLSQYPVTAANYTCEISLPVYYDLTDAQVKTVAETVSGAVRDVLSAASP